MRDTNLTFCLVDISNEWTAEARHEKFGMQINDNILTNFVFTRRSGWNL
jgi:hypothetical protein